MDDSDLGQVDDPGWVRAEGLGRAGDPGGAEFPDSFGRDDSDSDGLGDSRGVELALQQPAGSNVYALVAVRGEVWAGIGRSVVVWGR
jgi:hypothetical protein